VEPVSLVRILLRDAAGQDNPLHLLLYAETTQRQ